MGTFEVASKFLLIILILGEIAQVPVRTTSSLPIHSSEETSILDSTMLLSTEWSSSMTYTSITDWSASAWSESLSTFTIDINNTKTSDNPPMKADTESTYVGLDTKASKLKTVTSEEISKFDSTVILSKQPSSSMTYTPNIHSSDAAFSSNSKVNLQTNETSGHPQTETETSSTVLKEGLSEISSVNSSTSMISETISAFITSTNTESNYLGLNSDTSKLQTASSEDTSTFDSTAILSTQLFSSMTYTLTTNWSVLARSDSLSIHTDGITSTETSGNAPIETTRSSTELNETFPEIFSVTPLSSMILEATFAFSASTDTESTYIDISKMQTVSSEKTTTLDWTILLSTEWSSSMLYTSITDWSASARSDSLTISTINLNNTETSENPPRNIDTEFTYLGLIPVASKTKAVSADETATFDSTDILSTQLFSSNTYTPNIFWSASIELESSSILTVNINGTESSGYPSLKTEISVTVLNETFSEKDFLASSTSVLLGTTYAFTASENTESSYFGFKSEPFKIQTVSLKETSILESTVTLSTQSFPSWSAYVRSDSFTINTVSITTNETNGNTPIETGTTSTALNETLSAIFAMTPSTSTMLETVAAFSASKYTESSYSGFDTEASKMQTVSSDETSTLDLTILMSTEWFLGMTYTSITDWSASAWSDSLSTFTININNTKTSDNPPMKTDTESIRLDTEASKMKTVASEEISTFDSTVILSTQLSSSMTYTPDIIWSAPPKVDSLSIFTVNKTSIETSEYPSLETETSPTVLNETFSKTFALASSTSLALDTTSVFTTLGNTESSFIGLDSELSKIQTVSSEETSNLESTVMMSTQSSSSMTYTPITDWSAPVRSDSLSVDTVSINSNEISGNAPILTETSSITLNETLSTLLSNTPSKFVMLETTFTFSASTETKSAFSGLNRDTSKTQTVSSEKKSTFNSTSILSTQLSSSMTYKPIIDWSASAWTDSLSTFMISINNTETSVNPAMTTDTFSILLNETLSDIYYVTPSTSVILQTTFTFSASTYTKPTLSGFNTDTSKMQTVSSEDTPTVESTVILYTQLSSSMTYTPITDWIETTMSDNMSIFTVNITSTERSGHTPIDTDTSSIALNTILSEIVNLTSSTSVRLDTIFVFTASTDMESTFSGLNTDAYNIQTVSSEDTFTYNPTVIWSTQLSSSMTYEPSIVRSASTKLDVLSILAVKMTSTETSGYSSLETDTSSTELNKTFSEIFSLTSSTSVALETISALTSSGHTWYVGVNSETSKMQSVSSEETSNLESMVLLSKESSPGMKYTQITDWSISEMSDSLSVYIVSITSTETSGNASLETDTSSLALNKTFSEIFSFTSSTSLMLETIFTFSASSNRESTYLGLDTGASKIKTLLSEEMYTLDPRSILSTQSSSSMMYTSITHWSASAMFESLSVFTTNINNTATSETPPMKTDTESTYLRLESSKMKTVASEEISTFDSTVILSTQLSSSMTYTPDIIWSAPTKVDSLSIFTVNKTSTETSEYPSLETETSTTVLNETFSETFTLASSTSVLLGTTYALTASGNTESSYFGLESEPSKIQPVSLKETSILESKVILSTQESPNMTYTPTTGLSSFARSDSLSVDTVSINSNEISGNVPIETEKSSIILNETLSEMFSFTSPTSLMLESTFAFFTLSNRVTAPLGLDTETSKMQTVSLEETSTLDSMSILSSQSSSRSGYYTYAFQESAQSLLNIRSTISMEETSDFVHLSAASTLKLSVSLMHTYSSDWNVYTTRKNENTPYSPTIPALPSSVSFSVYGISTSSKAPDLGVIIGAVVGCVILLTFAILCLLICSLKRKRRQTRSEDSEDQVAGNVPEPSTSKMNILPLLQPFPETTVLKPMAAKATFALQKYGPLPPITPQLDWMKEIGDSWKKKKKRKHKPENVQTEEGHDTISPNEDQTGETETGNSNETLGTPDDVISERRQTSKKKKEKGATVDISTGDFTEREPIKNSMQRKEYNLSTDDITDNDETRISSKTSVSGEHTERARESLDIKAETKKKRKKKHRRHGEDRQDEETVHGLNMKSEIKKNKKKRKHEMEMNDLLQKEFEQDSERKEERKVRKHIKAEEDLLQSESVNDADIKKEKRKKKKKKKHRLDVDKELKDERVDDEVKAKQKKHHVDSEYVFQGESINDVDVTTDLKKYPKDRKGITDELETEPSVRLEEKMEISKNTKTNHENDNEEEHEGEPIDGIDKKPKLERKQKIKQRLDLLDEKTQYESAELGNETQKEGKHDLLQRQNDVERKEESEIVQNAEAMNNDKAIIHASLGDLATDVRESEVVSSEDVAYRSEKKKKKKKKKHPSQEVERENTQTINDIVEPDAKRKKRKKRHRAVPMTELDSSEEDVIRTRNKSHTEGDRGKTGANAKDHIVSLRPDKQSIEDNTLRPITSEINKDIAEIQVKPKIAFVEVERTQGDFVQDSLKVNNEEQNIKTIEGESFA